MPEPLPLMHVAEEFGGVLWRAARKPSRAARGAVTGLSTIASGSACAYPYRPTTDRLGPASTLKEYHLMADVAIRTRRHRQLTVRRTIRTRRVPPRGAALSEAVVRDISARRSETGVDAQDAPEVVEDSSTCKPMPTWGSDLSGIDFDNIKYFVRSTEKQAADVRTCLTTSRTPMTGWASRRPKQRLVAGVAAQYESEVVYHKIRGTWSSRSSSSTPTPRLRNTRFENFRNISSLRFNKFAALNTACWSVATSSAVRYSLDIRCRAYFSMRTWGGFRRTLIISSMDAYVRYVEGCIHLDSRTRPWSRSHR